MSRKRFLTLAIITAALSLAVGFVLAGIYWGLPVILMIAALWLTGERRGWHWAGNVGLLLFIILTIMGLMLKIFAFSGMVTAGAALIGWEISHFNQYLAGVNKVINEPAIERKHQQRILTVAGAGLITAAIAATIQVNFGFGMALLLGLVAIAGLSLAIGFLRRESD